MKAWGRILRWVAVCAAADLTAVAAPVISEFMASNRTTLVDADGEHSDWIELYNPDAEPVDLAGWYLTDNAGKRTKWQFPSVTIPAQGYLVVFASDKDRTDPAGELHTNFALSADGEYLGLIKPDGITAVSDYAPEFAAQRADVSYGIGNSDTTGSGSVGYLQVPTPGTPNSAVVATASSGAAQVQLATPEGGADVFTSALPILVLDNRGFGEQSQADGERAGNVQLFEAVAASVDTPAGLKVRGSTSAGFPKRSYSIELHDATGANRAVSLLGLAQSADWALVSPWQYDPSYLRSAYTYALSNRLGLWAPGTRFAEVFFNSDNAPLARSHYAGVSVLTERIKLASDLVDITPLETTDVTGEAVTGGYVLKIDPKDDDEFGWRTSRGFPADEGVSAGTMLVVVSPKAAKLAPEQQAYVTNYVQEFEDALYADRAGNWATRDHLAYIDRPSWVDFHLLQVLTKNPDGLVRSAYFNKDRGGKLKAGPVWDFDRAMGSVDPRSERWDEWNEATQSAQFWETGWWGVLARDPDFMQAWVDRWQTLRRDALATEQLTALANLLGAQIDPEAAARDAVRWPENTSRFGGTHRGEVDHLIAWLTNRAAWIDQQFVAAPVVVTSNGARQITAPAGGMIVYTLDGSDPRASGGGMASTALAAVGPLVVPVGATATVRIYVPTVVTGAGRSPWSSSVVSQPAAETAEDGNATPAGIAVLSVRSLIDAANPRVSSTVVVTGSTAKTLVVRAVGPTLASLGVSDPLADPVVSVVAADGTVVAANADWRTGSEGGGLATMFAAAGAFPLEETARDAALAVALPPGTYAIDVTSASGGRGVVLAEIYATNDASAVHAVSSAAVLGAGQSFVGGLTITGSMARTVLIRAIGPASGASDAAPDPALTFCRGTVVMASNDDWSYAPNASAIASAAAAAGVVALPTGSTDAAALLTLSPGTYSFQASAAGERGGTVRFEVIEVP